MPVGALLVDGSWLDQPILRHQVVHHTEHAQAQLALSSDSPSWGARKYDFTNAAIVVAENGRAPSKTPPQRDAFLERIVQRRAPKVLTTLVLNDIFLKDSVIYWRLLLATAPGDIGILRLVARRAYLLLS